MKTLLILFPILASFYLHQLIETNKQPEPAPGAKSVRIELRMGKDVFKDSGKVIFQEVGFEYMPKRSSSVMKPKNGLLIITEPIEVNSYLNFYDLIRVNREIRYKAFYLVEPGDDVIITAVTGERFHFSGPDAEKYRLQYELDSTEKAIRKPINKSGTANFYVDSLQEYYLLTAYYKSILEHSLPVLEKYKGRVADTVLQLLKSRIVNETLSDISDKFNQMRQYGFKGRMVSRDTLRQVFDTYHSPLISDVMQHSPDKDKSSIITRHNFMARTFDFDPERMPNEVESAVIHLEDVLRVYKGKEKDIALMKLLPKAMHKIGLTPRMEQILGEFYSSNLDTQYINTIKREEARTRVVAIYWKTPKFNAVDEKGQIFSEAAVKGKITVLNFEANESDAVKKKPVVQKAIDRFRNHPHVLFVNISTEKDLAAWRKKLSAVKDLARNVVNVHAGQRTADNETLKKFVVPEYPYIGVLDSAGGVVSSYPSIDFTEDEGDKLVEFIQDRLDLYEAKRQKAIVIKKDGPYVLYDGSGATAYSIDSTQLLTQPVSKNNTQTLTVQTDRVATTFSVKLKQQKHELEPCVYPAARKILVLSDIEGNFDAFRKLLRNNGVIDDNFNWAFGDGHVVFAGDMFDRGNQVTECLWLMYSMEEKATKAGGYVHFVLGNHEIMNMQGYHYYATDKYKKNAALVGKTMTELYNEDSELGRWLRTKNVIEKIGDHLFVHGGISPEVNRLPLTIEDINRVVRPYYGNRNLDSTDKTLLTLYNSTNYGSRYRISPFWSRGYYKQRSTAGVGKISDAELDSSLTKFDVRHIITGHSVVADTVSVHYGGRVFNTDTRHASGKSEALLIEGDKYYRVDVKGIRRLIFVDVRRRAF